MSKQPSSHSNKIISRDQAAELVTSQKQQGKKIVFTNGCFDILHVGHTRYLQAAKDLGDLLIVGLNNDNSVRQLKGSSRPINSEDERAEMLAALACIDYVSLFDELTPEALIAATKPDIHVKGGDYKIEDLPEAKIVHGYGGEVVVMPLVNDRSTSRLIKRIKET